MDTFGWTAFGIIVLFSIGYFAIILEHYVKVSKAAIALIIAVGCWMIYFLSHLSPLSESLTKLNHHVSDVSQIIFFLMGSMTLVEMIDSHRGFKKVTDLIQTSSKRWMLWIIAFVSFFLSSVLDNLTTTILMISLLRKLLPDPKERFLLCCIVVVAANAGGAWTPIGDVTTTMLWINGQISTVAIMKSLFLPSLISLLVPLVIYTFNLKGQYTKSIEAKDVVPEEPGAKIVFCVGVGALIFVPIFKAWTGLPPFMGVLIGLGVLWLVTDLLHHKYEQRQHLRIPHILTRIDTSGVLFFLGILLCINALESAGLLQQVARWLDAEVHSEAMIATLIGLFSAVIDNVPLVAATIGMYPLDSYPIDSRLWQMIAYAAGTGGSILIIGSSSGVALMGMEKIDFIAYLKKASLPVLLGYLAGMGIYLILH
jgi:NhaD family Na+/H+ antiporter